MECDFGRNKGERTMARNSEFVFLAKQIEMPDIRVYKALHSRFAVHNVQKRSTLL